MFTTMGMSEATAAAAAHDVHRDPEHAALVHVTQELGLDPREKPSPWVAAISSFVTFSLGAVIPLLPFLLGFTSLVASFVVGGVGLFIAGGPGLPRHGRHVVAQRPAPARLRSARRERHVRRGTGDGRGRQPVDAARLLTVNC